MKKVFEDIDKKEICARLRRVREYLGYKNPLHFAKKFGINYTTYLNYEKNRVPPSEFLIVLKEKYGHHVNTDWILTGEGDPIISKTVNAIVECDPQTTELIEMALQVIQSNTTYGASLKTNIHSFHQAVTGEEKFKALEKELEEVGCKHFVSIDGARIRHDDPPQEKEEILKRRAF